MFDPDELKPEQIKMEEYLFAPDLFDTPEKNLLAMVLDRAIRDYFTTDIALKREVETWFLIKEEKKIFSFLWICEALDLDSAKIITYLKNAGGIPTYRKISIDVPASTARKRVKSSHPHMTLPWMQ